MHSLNDRFPKHNVIWEYSNPRVVQKKAREYLGSDAVIFMSTRKNKKYCIFDKNLNKWIHFGQLGYEDYTKHLDNSRRKNYLARSTSIRGDWKTNKYSPNNLSIHLLW
jgi:hypothetical protein